ncbi:MAG: VWA domain-containing protein [Hyphomonadaceae bacterium]|nr:VWA domain-containing protein [Hyphomonadaceae bacterium]
MNVIGPWDRALLCGVLSMARPDVFGGILIRAAQGPVLSNWLRQVESFDLEASRMLMVPASVGPDRLQASLSVARSLSEGRAIYQTGLLEEAAGRVMVVNGVERIANDVAALLASGLDQANGIKAGHIAFIGVDESFDGENSIPGILAERLAFRADLHGLRANDLNGIVYSREDPRRIRASMSAVSIDEAALTTIAAACLSLGIRSMQVPIFCMHAARGLAALKSRSTVDEDDIAVACQLVLPGRAHPMPETEAPPPQHEDLSKSDPDQSSSEPGQSETDGANEAGNGLETQIIEAVTSAPIMLDGAPKKGRRQDRSGVSGRSGENVIALDRGRPDRPLKSQSGRGRIDVLATLRAASPMQAARQRASGQNGLHIRKSDLRIKRFRRRKQSSVIFIVDASGSAAMHRMAEAKGAVERLLSQCYSRRDLVSLIAFSGEEASVMLPPSRSLVRARRQISDLAGGGATPLAHALVEAYKLARAERDRGRTPFLVFLTDGRGNITLDGTADRAASHDQVSNLGRTLIKGQFPAVFFDTSRRPDPRTRRLSDDLGAQYQFLPNADGDTVSKIVRQRIGTR